MVSNAPYADCIQQFYRYCCMGLRQCTYVRIIHMKILDYEVLHRWYGIYDTTRYEVLFN